MKAYVESIQGDIARVLIGDEGVAVSIPISQLPGGTREGARLRVKFTVDVASSMLRQTKSSDTYRE